MTQAELQVSEELLRNMGYRTFPDPYQEGAYIWCKGFLKEENPYEEDRAMYQVILHVFDWRKYFEQDPILKGYRGEFSLTAEFNVSRSIEEVAVRMKWDMPWTKDRPITKDDMEIIEGRGKTFLDYVEDNFGSPFYDDRL